MHKIKIKQSLTADSRSCDYSKVSKETLYASSEQHIGDVKKGLLFFVSMLIASGDTHDRDKLYNIDQFHADFITGFKTKAWWENHLRLNRHHLTQKEGIPKDVNLVDVLEMIVDCVMAGMGRTGKVYDLELPPGVLNAAFKNTVELLKVNVEVVQND